MSSGMAKQLTRLMHRVSHRHVVSRSFLSPTLTILEKHTLKVPTMGDSITEGTIVEWTTSIGQMVKEGDVVALVETDKVTVDIKADMGGVITQQFGAVNDTVEVGADLCEIDTEVEASLTSPVEASSSKESGSPPAQEKATAPVAAAPTTKLKHRTPSIKFLGKEGWRRHLSPYTSPVVYAMPPNYGRPKFSEEEMEALMTGGANLVPNVKQLSNGAVFSY